MPFGAGAGRSYAQSGVFGHKMITGTKGAQRQVEVAAKMRETKRLTDLTGGSGGSDIWDLIREEETQDHLMRPRTGEYGDQVTV